MRRIGSAASFVVHFIDPKFAENRDEELNPRILYLAYRSVGPSADLIVPAVALYLVAFVGIVLNGTVLVVTAKSSSLRGSANFLVALICLCELVHQIGHTFFLVVVISGTNFVSLFTADLIMAPSIFALNCGLMAMFCAAFDRLFAISSKFKHSSIFTKHKFPYLIAHLLICVIYGAFTLNYVLANAFENAGNPTTGSVAEIFLGPVGYKFFVGTTFISMCSVCCYVAIFLIIRCKNGVSQQTSTRLLRSLVIILAINIGGYFFTLAMFQILQAIGPMLGSPIRAWQFGFIAGILLNAAAGSNAVVLYFNRSSVSINLINTLYLAYGSVGPSADLIVPAVALNLVAFVGIVLNGTVLVVTVKSNSLRGSANFLMALICLCELVHQIGHTFFLVVVISGTNFVSLFTADLIMALYLAYRFAGPSADLIVPAVALNLVALVGIVLNGTVLMVTVKSNSLRGSANFLMALICLCELVHQIGHTFFLVVIVSGTNFVGLLTANLIMAPSIFAFNCGSMTMFCAAFDRLFAVALPFKHSSIFNKYKLQYLLGHMFICTLYAALFQHYVLTFAFENAGNATTGMIADTLISPEVGPKLLIGTTVLSLSSISCYMAIFVIIRCKKAVSQQTSTRLLRSLIIILSISIGGYFVNLVVYNLLNFFGPIFWSPIRVWQSGFITAILLNAATGSNAIILYLNSTEYRRELKEVLRTLLKLFCKNNAKTDICAAQQKRTFAPQSKNRHLHRRAKRHLHRTAKTDICAAQQNKRTFAPLSKNGHLCRSAKTDICAAQQNRHLRRGHLRLDTCAA
ncbi:hypothetical protein niasHS_001082 [Heterodera schachtii]|uniref:G-protein coupled receptors family 1 profile domain-containing protein n=1 Tax=Heterodera schachtii TaxID=97005 RepID=A0ABD2K8K9_HETSC